MSYSLSVKAATVALALSAVAEKFAEVVAQQPVHANDADAVNVTAKAVADVLPVSEADRDVQISVNGWINTARVSEGAPPFVTGLSVTASASLVERAVIPSA